ncbi:aldo/keto reductase [uncultured Dubosiella sp.]|uniref:aldo/keto reductase n=2 Tax=uncultured Dubosiella sp. TaxID=1937011 RepID=UPI0025DD46AF|nr:aldo/keto reductase [uncultured Dubosiella sp.]
MEKTKLNNDVEMPVLGLGTFLMLPAQAEKAVYDALECGYEMIDTANAYMNEKAVGRGIRKAGKNDVFLVSKLWPTVYEEEDAVEKTLARLGVDHLDLMFLHQPAGNFMTGYRLLEKAYKKGLIKAIGLSNFHDKKLQKVLDECEIKPQVIQYECHPYYHAEEVMDVLAPLGVKLMCWYPLGHGDKMLIGEEVFKRLAEKYNKTNAQIILRWHIQKGHIVIPGSTNPEHIRQNADIFEFALTDEEIKEIDALNCHKRYYTADNEKEESYASMILDFADQE